MQALRIRIFCTHKKNKMSTSNPVARFCATNQINEALFRELCALRSVKSAQTDAALQDDIVDQVKTMETSPITNLFLIGSRVDSDGK